MVQFANVYYLFHIGELVDKNYLNEFDFCEKKYYVCWLYDRVMRQNNFSRLFVLHSLLFTTTCFGFFFR